MTEADEYRQFANDCIVWARIATSDNQRARLVELAKQWEAGAKELERARVVPDPHGRAVVQEAGKVEMNEGVHGPLPTIHSSRVKATTIIAMVYPNPLRGS
jgi:hypothetical protein